MQSQQLCIENKSADGEDDGFVSPFQLQYIFNQKPVEPQYESVCVELKQACSFIDDENIADVKSMMQNYPSPIFVAIQKHIQKRLRKEKKEKVSLTKMKNFSDLPPIEQHIARQLAFYIKHNNLLHLVGFFKREKISKRLASFFFIEFCQKYPIKYYMDQRKRDFKMLHGPNPEDSLKKTTTEEKLQDGVFLVDVGECYSSGKSFMSRRYLGVAPYDRGPTTLIDGQKIQMTELQFLIWASDVGVLEALVFLRKKVEKYRSELKEIKRKKRIAMRLGDVDIERVKKRMKR